MRDLLENCSGVEKGSSLGTAEESFCVDDKNKRLSFMISRRLRPFCAALTESLRLDKGCAPHCSRGGEVKVEVLASARGFSLCPHMAEEQKRGEPTPKATSCSGRWNHLDLIAFIKSHLPTPSCNGLSFSHRRHKP